MNAFGSVLKDIRKSRGLSQHDLASQMGSTQRHVSFVETGRSSPTDYFVTRLCRTLDLTLGQRANLFDAAGLPPVYLKRELASDEVQATLDLIDGRILSHWPFPAIVLDSAWTIMRNNRRFRDTFGAFLPATNAPPNLLDLFLEPHIRGMIPNFNQMAEVIYLRLQSAAARNGDAARTFARAKDNGLFDALPQSLLEAGQAPVIASIQLHLPNGQELEMTSLAGRLIAAHDCLVEGFEIEFFVPCNDRTEQALRGD